MGEDDHKSTTHDVNGLNAPELGCETFPSNPDK